MNKYTEIIDKYITGQMSSEEKKEFEIQLENNTELKKEFEYQKQILKGIELTGMKTKIKQGLQKGKLKVKTKQWLTGILIVALATSIVLVVKNKTFNTTKENIRYELNEENKKNWSEADKQLTPQLFTIKSNVDTVIETQGGIIVSIPANAFLNNNSPVNGEIELELKEALTPFDIMKSGLSTTSNGKLLETGGMFYINAIQNGKNLSINQTKGVYVSIPDNNPGKKMMLFDGERLENGQINWINPKPFENKLNTVDILSLNFYPPNFLDSLKQFGYDIKNKHVTDSIYYSFSCWQQQPVQMASESIKALSDSVVVSTSNEIAKKDEISISSVTCNLITASASKTIALSGEKLFKQNCAVCHSLDNSKLTGPGMGGVFERVPKGDWLTKYIINNEKLLKSGDPYANKIYKENGKVAMTVFEGQLSEKDVQAIIDYIKNNSFNTEPEFEEVNCEIAPSRIHAIWDRKFNNTLLATKEFEERLQAIFKTCNHNILNLYIRNLNKKMYEIDSLAMRISEFPQFTEFYNRHDGGVSINESHMKKLQAYMEEKRKVYEEVASATMKKIYERENIQSIKALREMREHNTSEANRIITVFNQELKINMDNAYKQLGKDQNSMPPPARNYLSSTITTPGWKNVDAYVIESTVNRTTLNYTDKETGKKAIIRYEPFAIKVSDFKQFDRVLAYLIPDKINCFQRMPDSNAVFKENLNELISYGAVVFGFKGDDVYCSSIANAKAGEQTVELRKMSREELLNYRTLNAGAAINIVSELDYQFFEHKESLRKKSVAKREEIRGKLWGVVFPCNIPGQQVPLSVK